MLQKQSIGNKVIYKKAFTLAEILVTLGIVGVVAAMTIPQLITNIDKTITAAKVKKFYSMINQVVKMSVNDNGGVASWNVASSSANFQTRMLTIETYFMPYMKLSDCKALDRYGVIACALPDGGGIMFEQMHGNVRNAAINIDYVTDYKKIKGYSIRTSPKSCFYFTINNSFDIDSGKANAREASDEFVVPYMESWDGTYQGLYTKGSRQCSAKHSLYPGLCTKLFFEDGMKFSKNYYWH